MALFFLDITALLLKSYRMNMPLSITITYSLLLLAILTFSIHKRKEGLAIVILALVVGTIGGAINPFSALFASLGFILLKMAHTKPTTFNLTIHVAFIAWCAALYFHWVPGFHNWQVLKEVYAGPESTAFSMYANLDKPLIFCALSFGWAQAFGNHQSLQPRMLLISVSGLVGMLLLAWGLGAIRPELTLPAWWWIFALNNLLLTCTTEEALFRGYFQQGLSTKIAPWSAILIASLLFGLSHYHGGTLLIAFATLAGIFYGIAFQYSSRLWVAIMFHFLFNLSHLLIFTYPSASM